jgi:GT2 family glycosyltransferase
LQAIGLQTFGDFEVVIVDSSPTDECRRIATSRMPGATYVKCDDRLLAHEASNLGVEQSHGPLVAFLDPDVYPSAQWLADLVGAWRQRGGAIVGGIACFGERWIDLGAHLAKFDKWLAGGPGRSLTEAATANFLIERALFERSGGFRPGTAHADTDLSWRLRDGGDRLWLEPKAFVQHHHRHTWSSLLKERYDRGGGYGQLWLDWVQPSRLRLAWTALISLVPVRLISQTLRVVHNASVAGLGRQALITSPVMVTALYAWLVAEAGRYLKALARRS